MRIILERYYGDEKVTMSRLKVGDFVCEAREMAFRDYETSFEGCSAYCMPVGVFRCVVRSTPFSRMTISVAKAPGHRGCKIVWSDTAKCQMNAVLIGQNADDSGRLTCQRETMREFEALVYDAWARGEEYELEVRNALEPAEE